MREATAIRPLYIALVLATTAIAAARVWAILEVDGITWLEIALFAIFVVLFCWISVGFWLACLGVFVRLRGPQPVRSPLLQHGAPSSPTRTAILMPVYNESSARVFAGVRAMLESIRAVEAQDQFDFYILSDSTKPECHMAEEIEWLRLRKEIDQPVYYRHRPLNTGRKPGNIADFCKKWGGYYAYMVVLDADSLMTGETLVAMAGMMDANPDTALIQAPSALIGGSTLFGVIQQFTSRLYGPLHTAGFAALQGSGGNFWGHNAIIRVQAFVENCGLPKLSGPAPLGGEILSHDFVEAALLRKAGWKLWLVPELGGSFEETPSGVIDHLARDRRWCQGNMQHIRLLFAQGLRPSSRIHFIFGIMSYVSSPLWLLLLCLALIEAGRSTAPASFFYIGKYPILNLPVSHATEILMLIFATSVLLFGPKFVALIGVMRDPAQRRGFGGMLRLTRNIVLESIFSAIYAPIAALTHSWFILNTFLGKGIAWTPPRRGDSATSLASVATYFAPHTVIAIVVGAMVWRWLPDAFGWLVPMLLGPLIAIPLAKLVSEPGLGSWLLGAGYFAVPGEGSEIARRVDDLLTEQDPLQEVAPDDLVRTFLTAPLQQGLRAAIQTAP
jgi:membrane glycosyltransferase